MLRRAVLSRARILTAAAAAALMPLALSAASTAAPAASTAAAAASGAAGQATAAAAVTANGGVSVNLFEWNWDSVAAECTNHLGPEGAGSVQVAPPAESVSLPASDVPSGTAHPWWEVYQPVSYSLTSRMGDEAQFAAMVSACHSAGVAVIADAVLNHMAGNNPGAAGYGGCAFSGSGTSYPCVPYTAADFHHNGSGGDCPTADGQIDDQNDPAQAWNCELEGLPDLATGLPAVQDAEAAYLNHLIALGVDGFRLDAAKQIPPADIASVESMLATTTWKHTAPAIVQEVAAGSTNAQLQYGNYEATGSVINFDYAFDLKSAFTGGGLSGLNSLAGLPPGQDSLDIVTNQDLERAGSSLTSSDGAPYVLANDFMLAYPYGTPQLYDGFTFSSYDQPPPDDPSTGMISDVTDATCGTQWQCLHRQAGVAAMIGWHNVVAGTAVANWTATSPDVIAFSRGAKGWIAINNTSAPVTASYATGLPDGFYCDVITGGVSGGSCAGTEVSVSGGLAAVTIPASSAIAVDVNATTQTAPPVPADGSESYFDTARKDCVGTARNTTSKVWFTVADGMLSDTYWPTVDATNVHSLQYLVTDGHSFTDLQARDMTYTVRPDPTGMECTVIASDAARHYRITTSYITDPDRASVLMHVTFSGPAGDQLYVRLDPLAGGTGGGGTQNAGANSASVAAATTARGRTTALVAANPSTVTDAVNRTYAVPTYEALESSAGFSAASAGYAGTASDGAVMLDASHQLTGQSAATDGHVALTAGLRLASNKTADLALGFGTTQGAALATASASVTRTWSGAASQYLAGWTHYDAGLKAPSRSLGSAAAAEYYESVNVVKASEDKTFTGAIAAGLASPWGQSVPAGELTSGEPTYFGSYREVFARDQYEAFTGLLVAGDLATARAATYFLFDRQQTADGSLPRNSLLNGEAAPDTGGLQLDETSYPILMAWQSGLAKDATLYRQHVIPAADFLVAHGPSDGVERWEEQTGYSPSTIAAEIAGLTAAAHIAAANSDPARSRIYQATADYFARNVKAWTVTTTGPYAPSYFIRLSKTGDPNAAVSYDLGNGSVTADQRSVVDAGFLDLVRLGVLPASDPDVRASLPVVDSVLERQTPSGPGYYRYGTSSAGSEDGYGDCYEPDPTTCSPTGAPWAPTSTGSGHLWPVLDGERGEYDIAARNGGAARSMLTTMANMTSGQGLEPEQAWEDPPVAASPQGTDPAAASIGFATGKAAGSASPLTWAQAQYARLALDISAGRNLETPSIVTSRYVTHGMPGSLPLTVTSPASGSSVTSATVTVTGTTVPGARVDASAQTAAGGTAGTGSAAADSSGQWSLTIPASFGTTTITVTATSGGRTGYDQFAVTDVALPGTTVLSVTDPAGDDNGPGTYAYPTAADFQPGAFDLTGMTVSQTDTDVYIQVKVANLASTFGAVFGAQLLDLYIRNPAATATSSAAAFASRNYTIAPADAWSERIEAQGFSSPLWQDASGASLGTPQFITDAASGTATLVLPRSAFGDVSSGWVFTVALTGQDGFSADQARAFTATPGADSFGVCPAAGDTSPVCSLSPSSVPEVMDTIVPAGVTQAAELDPTAGPVQLAGPAVP